MSNKSKSVAKIPQKNAASTKKTAAGAARKSMSPVDGVPNKSTLNAMKEAEKILKEFRVRHDKK